MQTERVNDKNEVTTLLTLSTPSQILPTHSPIRKHLESFERLLEQMRMSSTNILVVDLFDILPHPDEIGVVLNGSMLNVCDRHGGVQKEFV